MINRRLLAVYAGFLVALIALWGRCVWLQVIAAPRLSRLADAQHWTARPLVAPRGAIYDRHGRVLAMSVRTSSVFANPRQVADKSATAVQLAHLVGRPAHMIDRRLRRDKGFVWIARQAGPGMTESLRPLRRQGVGIVEEAKRVYPHGMMASHLLGYVDIDQHGLEGLELEFNGVLRGRPGWMSTLRDAKGDVLIGPWTSVAEPDSGLEMVLTLDAVVQQAAEEALRWGVKKFNAKGGSIIVIDPATGGILAMANQPEFDPNAPGRTPADRRRNRAVTDLMEPGSVFKIVTAAALLEEGLVRPEEVFFCEQANWPTVGRHILHDHRPHGALTFHDVIMLSSNIGTAKAAQRLKPDALYRYIRAFGFGQRTGFELPGEVRGIVPAPSRWSKLSPYIIPIGQEVAVTPIQLAKMMAIVANGGWTVDPYLVERVQEPGGRVVRRHAPEPKTRLLRGETAEQLHDMLSSVVESGTGQLARVRGLIVAGKTGTAQKVEPNGRYSHSRYIASFVGYGPVPDPRFAMVVTVDEPRPLYFGGVVASPIFSRVAGQLAGYWGLNPPAGSTTIAQLP